MEIALTRDVAEAIVREAEIAHPLECCGILFGTGECIDRSVAATNIHPAPATHFEIDPQPLIDAHRAARGGGDPVIGYYHSHPNGLARPSATDRAMAAGASAIWLIVAEGDISAWKDAPEGFARLSLRVIDA